MRNVLHATLLTLLLSAPLAHADDTSPVGLWQTIDDVTHKPTALIRITEQNGQLQGRIDKLIVAPGANPNPTCIACTGTLKNQPVVGLTILSGLKKDGASYSGGEILDPNLRSAGNPSPVEFAVKLGAAAELDALLAGGGRLETTPEAR
jgi:hypothetical protein